MYELIMPAYRLVSLQASLTRGWATHAVLQQYNADLQQQVQTLQVCAAHCSTCCCPLSASLCLSWLQ